MKLTRRSLLAGAAAIPAVVGMDRLAAATPGEGGVFLYDGSLPHARQRAVAASGWGEGLREITGDRIRFAREVLSHRPARVSGISRQADALLMEEVAAEAGYRRERLEVDGAAIHWSLVRRT